MSGLTYRGKEVDKCFTDPQAVIFHGFRVKNSQRETFELRTCERFVEE
jgi:hypothetical protein